MNPISVEMIETTAFGGYSQADFYRDFRGNALSYLQRSIDKHNFQRTAHLAQILDRKLALLPDICTKDQVVLDELAEDELFSLPALPADRLYPKEDKVVKLSQDGPVLLLVRHFSLIHGLTPRLREAFELAGVEGNVPRNCDIPYLDRYGVVAESFDNGAAIVVMHLTFFFNERWIEELTSEIGSVVYYEAPTNERETVSVPDGVPVHSLYYGDTMQEVLHERAVEQGLFSG